MMTKEKTTLLLRVLCTLIALNFVVIWLAASPRIHLVSWIINLTAAVVILVVWWRSDLAPRS
jgi:hypothetical protein